MIGLANYQNEELAGVLVDLYRVYSYVTGLKFDRIYLFSDFEEDTKISKLLPALIQGIVDQKVSTFINDLKKKGEYIYISKQINPITFQEKLGSRIDDKKIDQLLFYFTGHGNKQGLLLPSGETFPFVSLRNFLVSKMADKSQGLWILDCCCPSGFKLPYYLNYDSHSRFIMKKPYYKYTPKPKIICITSSSSSDEKKSQEEETKSISTHLGSVFTGFLFDCLDKGIYHIPYLQRSISHKIDNLKYTVTQKVLTYSSDPTLFDMWDWLQLISPRITVDKKYGVVKISQIKDSEK